MTLYRRTSTATAALLILATIAALTAAALDPTLTGRDYLGAVADHPDREAAAVLCYLIAAGTSAGTGIALYPLLSAVSSPLALGSVVFRAIEAVLYTTAVVSLLSIVPLAQDLATTPAGSRAPIQAMADTLLGLRDHSTLAGAFAFTVGASMYYALFYRSRLVPRWLAGWGLAGVLLMLAACLLALFQDRPVTGYTPLIVPIALQEMVLAVWLLVRGFNASPQTFVGALSTSAATLSGPVRRVRSETNAEGFLMARPGLEANPR